MEVSYLPWVLRLEHSLQRGLLPVPSRLFSVSMLLPVLQFVLLWWTSDLMECHGLVLGIFVSLWTIEHPPAQFA